MGECRKLCAMLEEKWIDAIGILGNINGKAEKMIGQEFDGYKLIKNDYLVE